MAASSEQLNPKYHEDKKEKKELKGNFKKFFGG